VFLGGHTAAVATHCFTKTTTTCSPMIGQPLDTIIAASSDKQWLRRPIKIQVLETVLSHLKKYRKVLQNDSISFQGKNYSVSTVTDS